MEQNVSRICHKIYFPNDTSEVSPCAKGLGPPASWPTAQRARPPALPLGGLRRAGRSGLAQLFSVRGISSPPCSPGQPHLPRTVCSCAPQCVPR